MFLQTEYGEMYDCVDVYKQPALDHPLLKDHVVQVYYLLSIVYVYLYFDEIDEEKKIQMILVSFFFKKKKKKS